MEYRSPYSNKKEDLLFKTSIDSKRNKETGNSSSFIYSILHKVANYNEVEENSVKKRSINVDSMGNELTEAQQEYFENSKVRDEEGRLKPLYHGTKNEFTVFDINKNHVITFGYGFYFEKR